MAAIEKKLGMIMKAMINHISAPKSSLINLSQHYHEEEPSSTYWPPQGQEEESSPIYYHSYSSPHQHYQEEPLSLKMSALKETMATLEEVSARLNRMMSTFLSEVEEDRQTFKRINNSITQSYEKMDAHFKQIMDILKEEKCQGQLVANPNEYYMEDEYTYYLEQTTTTLSDADRDAGEYMRKNGRDMEVEPPRRMMTRSQTRGPEAEYSASVNDPP
jgi:hypothetical protein